ncbi:mediator of RNA polymerase II transcription subunit 6 [Culicoides brevitarsis]|uniref:mediator of RNA polymerase II transcription subunit 6 n=1 Tax=Culicoides brevitarsis TaxID=469753 RepID=UPI00307B63BF
MMPARLPNIIAAENPLHISWHDSNWIPILNTQNVMDYFSEKSNPFYERTCNNEVVRMQRQSMDNLSNMIGVEYILLHVQEPILYVIRKQHRHSPESVTPLADYYIIAGIVYQAPNLENVFSSRILSTVQHLQSAFEESSSYARYHPNAKGYSWDFSKTPGEKTKPKEKKEQKTKEEASSLFQRQRVDMLLVDLLRQFPPPGQHQQQQQGTSTSDTTAIKQELEEPQDSKDTKAGTEKSDMKPPPEKKMKMSSEFMQIT